MLYKPGYGLSFTTGRTPIGSSDFGLDMYTYDDVSSPDYNMEHFSTARDDKHLIPYIKAAETAAGKEYRYSHHRGRLRLDEDKRQT